MVSGWILGQMTIGMHVLLKWLILLQTDDRAARAGQTTKVVQPNASAQIWVVCYTYIQFLAEHYLGLE